MSSVEGGRLSEEERLEIKRKGEGSEIEEKTKRRRDDENMGGVDTDGNLNREYYESDFDDDNPEDFGYPYYDYDNPDSDDDNPEGLRYPDDENMGGVDMDGDLNRDYYISDSDDDNPEDFRNRFQCVEQAYGYLDEDELILYDEDEKKEKEEDKKCLDVSRCNKFQHSIRLDYKVGLPIFELFKVTLRLQDNKDSTSGFSSSSAPFYGAIVMLPEMRSSPVNPIPISYYWVSKNNANSISLYSDQNFNLPLSGPKPRPFIADCDFINLRFAFKFNYENVFKQDRFHKNSELYGDDDEARLNLLCLHVDSLPILRYEEGGPRISRYTFGPRDCNRIIVSAYYSLFHGTWATVDVKFLKKGSASKFYGLIFARPCIFYSRIRLLSIKSTRLVELQESQQPVVELTRSVVAVPFYSSLIIAVDLYDQDDKELLRGKTFFPASTKGSHSKCIEDKNTGAMLQVTVKWSCEP